MNEDKYNFLELFKKSKRFKITIVLTTMIYVATVVFLFVGISKNNEKIVDLMRDRQISEFSKTYYYVTEHYKKLSEIFYKELEEHEFLNKLYENTSIKSLNKELKIKITKNYAFKSFDATITRDTTNETIYNFDIVNTTDGIFIIKTLFLNNRYLGELEIKIKPSYIHEWIENLSHSHIYIVYKKDALNSKDLEFEESDISDHLFHNKINHSYIQKHHEESSFNFSKNEFEKINMTFKDKLNEKKLIDESIVEWVKIKQNDVAVIFKPIFNISGNQIGYIINYVLDKEYTKYIKIYDISIMLFSIMIFTLYIFIIYTMYQQKIEKVKSIRLKTLVGDLKVAKNEISNKQLELLKINYNLEDRIEKTLNSQREKDKIMLQQSKLAAMGEMIGNIAHQWRQPLNALSLQIQDIKSAYEYNEIDKEYVQQTVDNSMKNIDYMSKTIDDFRKFFEPSKTKINFDIVDSIHQVLDIMSVSLKKHNIDVNIKSGSDKYISSGYPNEFKQVIMNIINNSRDAFVERKDKINKSLITIEIMKKNNQNIIKIQDNALGIPTEILDRVFEPYFTTKEEGKGTGIGLYMSKMIIEESMHGNLNVKNTDDGAIFTLKLNNN